MLPVRPLKGQFQRPDLRNHRKLLVVDGRVGFMGSQNLIEPGYNKPNNHRAGGSRSSWSRASTDPTVKALRAVFAKDWYTETHERLGDEIAAGHAGPPRRRRRRARCCRAARATPPRTTCASSRR